MAALTVVEDLDVVEDCVREVDACLAEGMLQRIDDVRAYQASGFVKAAQAQKMINQILAECTGGV